MIRPFIKEDLQKIKCNSITKDYYSYASEETFNLKTLEKEGEVMAIIGYRNYNLDNYFGFFMISEDISPIHSREIKKFVHDLAKDIGAKRLSTESVDDEVLNHWHQFLGFTKEGFRPKYYDNQDYNVWGLRWV